MCNGNVFTEIFDPIICGMVLYRVDSFCRRDSFLGNHPTSIMWVMGPEYLPCSLLIESKDLLAIEINQIEKMCINKIESIFIYGEIEWKRAITPHNTYFRNRPPSCHSFKEAILLTLSSKL